MNGLALLHGLGCPILLGASRQRTIGALSGVSPADQRLGGSLSLAMKGAGQGVQILRVHDVLYSVHALTFWRCLRLAALPPPFPYPPALLPSLLFPPLSFSYFSI